MKFPAFAYVAPTTVDEALAALADDDDARPLAGGQTLLPILALRMSTPTCLVDLNGIDALKQITLGEDGLKIERREGAIAHLPREISYEDFSDVVLWGAVTSPQDGDVMVGLSLYSAEHDLQVPVCVQTDVAGLAQYWTAWSHALGIPPKVLDTGDTLRDPFNGLGRLAQGVAGPRRLPSRRLDRGAYMPSSSWRRDAEVHARSV